MYYSIDGQSLSDLAGGVRKVTGSSSLMTVSEMTSNLNAYEPSSGASIETCTGTIIVGNHDKVVTPFYIMIPCYGRGDDIDTNEDIVYIYSMLYPNEELIKDTITIPLAIKGSTITLMKGLDDVETQLVLDNLDIVAENSLEVMSNDDRMYNNYLLRINGDFSLSIG